MLCVVGDRGGVSRLRGGGGGKRSRAVIKERDKKGKGKGSGLNVWFGDQAQKLT